MKNHNIVTFEDLCAIAGRKQTLAVVKYLREKRIRFELGGEGKPWTTIQALNQSIGIGAGAQTPDYGSDI